MVHADPVAVHHFWWLAKGAQVPTLKKEMSQQRKRNEYDINNRDAKQAESRTKSGRNITCTSNNYFLNVTYFYN